MSYDEENEFGDSFGGSYEDEFDSDYLMDDEGVDLKSGDDEYDLEDENPEKDG